MATPRAFLIDGAPLESVPLESIAMIEFADPRDGQLFDGYLIDVDALTCEELHAIYAEMRTRLCDLPSFDAWVETIKKEGMPIREQRVRSVAMDLRSVL